MARLYARRERWEIDRDTELQRAIEDMPFSVVPHLAYLVGFAQPIPPDREIWRRAAVADDVEALLADLFGVARGRHTPHDPMPSFSNAARGWRRAGSDMYVLDTAADLSNPDSDDSLRVAVNVDGRARLLCGRAGERLGRNGPDRDGAMYFFEDITAGAVAAFLAILGRLFARAGYLGAVDLGIAVLGIEDAH